jgi:tetratricopeptide (TPR) repeat protein
MVQDYYELLQVHPRADAAAIQAAYERLKGQYDPERLHGAADELVELARRKRASIEAAYAVLSDDERRRGYDAQLHGASTTPALPDAPDASDASTITLDYRPLPPARRSERPRSFDAQPSTQVTPRSGRLLGLPIPAVVGLLVLAAIAVTSLLITGMPGQQSAAPQVAAQPTPTISPLDEYEALIAQAKAATDANPNDADAWIAYGNHLYDSVQIVRENAPASTLYQQRLPRWLEASQAYERALTIRPGDVTVLADKGVSLCYYGAGAGDQSLVTRGLGDVREAAGARPDDALIQLSLGDCLMSTVPPQKSAAIESWQRVLQLAPGDSDLAKRAQELIQANSQ